MSGAFSGIYTYTPVIVYLGIIILINTESYALLYSKRSLVPLPYNISSTGLVKISLRLGWIISLLVGIGIAASVSREPIRHTNSDTGNVEIKSVDHTGSDFLYLIILYGIAPLGCWFLSTASDSPFVSIQVERLMMIRNKIQKALNIVNANDKSELELSHD